MPFDFFFQPLFCFLRFSTPISKHSPTREFNLPSTYFTKYFHKPYQTTSNWQLNSLTNYSKRKKEKKKKRLDCHHRNVTKTSTNPFNPLPMSPHDRSSCLNQLATLPSSKSSCSIGFFSLCGTGGRVGSCTRPGLIFRARSRKYNDSCKKAQVRPSWQRLPTNQRVQRMAAKVRGGMDRGSQGTRRARLYQFFDRLLIPLKRSIPLPPPVYAWACEFLWWQHAPRARKTNRRLRAALCAFFNDSTSSCPGWDGKRGGGKKGQHSIVGVCRYHRSILARWNLNVFQLDGDMFDFKRLDSFLNPYFPPFFVNMNWFYLYFWNKFLWFGNVKRELCD